MKRFITLLINFVLQNQWITINAEQGNISNKI